MKLVENRHLFLALSSVAHLAPSPPTFSTLLPFPPSPTLFSITVHDFWEGTGSCLEAPFFPFCQTSVLSLYFIMLHSLCLIFSSHFRSALPPKTFITPSKPLYPCSCPVPHSSNHSYFLPRLSAVLLSPTAHLFSSPQPRALFYPPSPLPQPLVTIRRCAMTQLSWQAVDSGCCVPFPQLAGGGMVPQDLSLSLSPFPNSVWRVSCSFELLWSCQSPQK